MKVYMTIIACVLMISTNVYAKNVYTPVDSSYKLIFDDEFNGTSVNTSRWNVLNNCDMGDLWSNIQFHPSAVSVANGFLILKTVRNSSCGRPYTGGFVYRSNNVKYNGTSYYEIRSKFSSNSHGFWPAWWMNSSVGFPEIDVYEFLGNTPTILWQTYHEPNDPTGGVGFDKQYQTGTDWTAGYHVYGVLREPSIALTWFVDGVQTFKLVQGQTFYVDGRRYKVSIDNTKQGPILNTAIGGWNNNNVDGTSVFPMTLSVDYIHIYAKSGTAVQPDANYGGPGYNGQ